MNIIKFHLMFSLIIFIFILGAQLSSKKHLIRNLLVLNDVEPGSEEAKKIRIPSDGFFRTLIISLIPFYNIKYAVFCVMLGFMPEDSDYIIVRRDIIREFKEHVESDN